VNLEAVGVRLDVARRVDRMRADLERSGTHVLQDDSPAVEVVVDVLGLDAGDGGEWEFTLVQGAFEAAG